MTTSHMRISPVNPVIQKTLESCITKDIFINEVCQDSDSVTYIIRSEQGSDITKFGFQSNCTDFILKNGGQEMLDEQYKGHQCPENQKMDEADLTLIIDSSSLPTTSKVKNSMSDEEKE